MGRTTDSEASDEAIAGGLRYQMEGELDRAIERYQRSIQAHPTAEAHTFLGGP